jgi:hypothetical protein
MPHSHMGSYYHPQCASERRSFCLLPLHLVSEIWPARGRSGVTCPAAARDVGNVGSPLWRNCLPSAEMFNHILSNH